MAFHTVSVPIGKRSSRANLAWPPQDPGTKRTLALDATNWLADGGRSIVGVTATADASLTCGAVGVSGGVTLLTVTGGAPGGAPVVAFALNLDNGDIEDVNVVVPIIALAPATPTGGTVLTCALTAGMTFLMAGSAYLVTG